MRNDGAVRVREPLKYQSAPVRAQDETGAPGSRKSGVDFRASLRVPNEKLTIRKKSPGGNITAVGAGGKQGRCVAVGGDRDGQSAQGIPPENLPAAALVIGNKILGLAVKRHIAALAADLRQRGFSAAAACAIGAQADQRRRSGLQIANENIVVAIGLVGRQVWRVADEGDVTSIGTQDRAAGKTVGAATARAVRADQNVGPGLQIADEDVLVIIRVVRRQIVGPAHKRNEPPVCAE